MDNSKDKTYFTERFIFPLIIGIIVGLTVSYLWQQLNSIKGKNICLFDLNRSAPKSIPNISVSPIEIKLSWLKRNSLRLGIHNNNIRTLKNGVLYIYFPDGVRVIGGEKWICTGYTSVYTDLKNINPTTSLILLPLEIEFSELKTYEGTYCITADDFTMQKKFLIKVIK